MDYLQYICEFCYYTIHLLVLNLIINGLPSIQKVNDIIDNTKNAVLNLIINGLPSIPWEKRKR